jgi:hypothetical protein
MGARANERIGVALLAMASVLLARSALADDAQTLELGRNRFDAGQYDEAARRFAAMLDPSAPPCDKAGPAGGCRLVDPDLIESARGLYATSLVALKRPDEATAQIEKILRQNHAFRPSPAVFPQEVIDRFTEARTRLGPEFELEARSQAERDRQKQLALKKAEDDRNAWIKDLQRLAGTETVVQKSSRAVALLPFGVGQFQNGDTGLGVFFAVSEALAGSAAIAGAVAEGAYSTLSLTTHLPQDVDNDINASTTVNRVAFGAFAALSLAGVVQAEIAFVPERSSTRPRPVPPPPPPPKVMPTVSFLPGGGMLGLVGRF